MSTDEQGITVVGLSIGDGHRQQIRVQEGNVRGEDIVAVEVGPLDVDLGHVIAPGDDGHKVAIVVVDQLD